jgi:hypothetical protein
VAASGLETATAEEIESILERMRIMLGRPAKRTF